MNRGSLFGFGDVGVKLDNFGRQETIQSRQTDNHILDIHIIQQKLRGLNTVINELLMEVGETGLEIFRSIIQQTIQLQGMVQG